MDAATRISQTVWDWRARASGAIGTTAARRAAARRQGLIQAAVGFTAAILIGFLWRPVGGVVVASVTALLAVLAFAAPAAHERVQALLQAFGRGVGGVFTWLLMPILFYLVFWPTGLLLRARQRLRITRGADRSLATYWTEPERLPTPESYRRQF